MNIDKDLIYVATLEPTKWELNKCIWIILTS